MLPALLRLRARCVPERLNSSLARMPIGSRRLTLFSPASELPVKGNPSSSGTKIFQARNILVPPLD